MHSLKRISLILLISFFIAEARAQTDSCNLRISLLTVTPGEELYSTFGHSALRITDTVTHQDMVYNYGTFNFDDPDFYMKFVRGKLMYYLSTDDFLSFQSENQAENRGITEQVLQLTCTEKRKLISLLEKNLLSENRFYKYDFLFDNCTTRLRDLAENAADSAIRFGNVLPAPRTFRNLIYDYLNKNDKQWSKLGIDILLGSRTDAIMTPYQVMFLPDYLMYTFDSSVIGGAPLVTEKQSLYKVQRVVAAKSNLTHPFFIFTCLLVFIGFLSFSKSRAAKKFLAAFDGTLFFITGLLGILLLFMWFGTDHIMCRDNYNLLWAWPFNVLIAFYLHSQKRWPRIYLAAYSVINVATIATWAWLPQHLNLALIPVILILILRSLAYVFHKN